jgi:hypothetical protein
MGERFAELETGPSYRFAEWPNRDVPMLVPGVYTIWHSGLLVYVGVAGTGVAVAELNDAGQPVKFSRGLYGRLDTHANGKRLVDPFSMAVCDRYVVPSLSSGELQGLAVGILNLDEFTKKHVRRHYEYRYLKTTTLMEASRIELRVRRGMLTAGPPLLNPAPALTELLTS